MAIKIFNYSDINNPILLTEVDDLNKAIELAAEISKSTQGKEDILVELEDGSDYWFDNGKIVEVEANICGEFFSFKSIEDANEFKDFMTIINDKEHIVLTDLYFNIVDSIDGASYILVKTEKGAKALETMSYVRGIDSPYHNDHFRSIVYTTETIGLFKWVDGINSYINIDATIENLNNYKTKFFEVIK